MPKVEYSTERHKVPFTSYTLPESMQYGRIKLLLGETVEYKFQRACVAEFIAMLFFVVICCGCAMVTLNLPNPNLMMVAASFGAFSSSRSKFVILLVKVTPNWLFVLQASASCVSHSSLDLFREVTLTALLASPYSSGDVFLSCDVHVTHFVRCLDPWLVPSSY